MRQDNPFGKREEGEQRQDPFARLGSKEPVQELGLTTPAVLSRRPPGNGRKTPVRPSEKRRRDRKMGLTFSSAEIPDRLRELAERWNLKAPGGGINVSAVVEYLLLPQLEAAEEGEIAPPPGSDSWF